MNTATVRRAAQRASEHTNEGIDWCKGLRWTYAFLEQLKDLHEGFSFRMWIGLPFIRGVLRLAHQSFYGGPIEHVVPRPALDVLGDLDIG